MSKVFVELSMSLDGFVNDVNGSVEALYPDLGELRNSEMLQEAMDKTGAVIMGRHSYEMANGDFTGYEYQVPLFIVTHEVPKTVFKGENGQLSFNFVTDGIVSAVRQAKAAAGDKDVTLVGGPDIIQQLLKAGLMDELQLGIMPVFLGSGLRLFEEITDGVKLEKVKLIESPGGRTDIYFHIVR